MRATRRVSLSVLVVLVVVASGASWIVGAKRGAASTPGTAAASGGPMDLVYISDSSGAGVADLYARHVRKDLGVAVRVHERWEGSLAASTILERLREPGHPWIPLVRNAELVVVYGNATGLGIKAVDSEACFGRCTRPTVSAATWRRYVSTLEAIYRRIFEIRQGRPVILRTANWYVPILTHGPVMPPGKSWEECGIVDACTRFWESFAGAIARAAASYRVPVADVYRAFNGPSHREDPVEKGYIQADNIHPDDAGRAVVAATLAALGYRQVTPPRGS